MSTKIYAKAKFGFREDSLKNWTENNPVLEKGEPAVISDSEDSRWLKIGDGITPFNALPWKFAGGGMADKVYDPTSENAQSGIAVAEAIVGVEDTANIARGEAGEALERVGVLEPIVADNTQRIGVVESRTSPKNYELIATIKVTPDENGKLPKSIVFSKDSNGNPFEITDFYCKVYAGISGVSSPKIQIVANDYMLISNMSASFTDGLRNWYFRFTSYGENNGGLFSAPNTTMGSAFPNANVSNGINLATGINDTKLNIIPKVAINVFTSGGVWIENSEFKLYGVRK